MQKISEYVSTMNKAVICFVVFVIQKCVRNAEENYDVEKDPEDL